MSMSIHSVLEQAIRQNASDVILKADSPPYIRIDGGLRPMDHPPIEATDLYDVACSIIFSAARDRMLRSGQEIDDTIANDSGDADRQMQVLRQGEEIDVVFTIPKLARIRANLFLQRGMVGAALRVIPLRPYTVDDLRLPGVLKDIAHAPQGLVIITGPTGSGKTTTMAAMIEEINRSRSCNIFTIEEPIEYVFEDKRSVIHQREVGADTQTFASALRSVLRQSPDVIVIGELRDAETMDVAMTAAEIGHLVITTLHTTSASNTVDRILSSFPPDVRHQVSAQLAASLTCVTSQRLAPNANGKGRVPAVEVMTISPTVRKTIEEGDTAELYTAIRDGQHFGMNTMNQALERLYADKIISYEEALRLAGNPTEMKHLLRRT